MKDETLKNYILDYAPERKKNIQIAEIDGYNFTFILKEGKAVGAVLDMNAEPHIYVLE